MLDIFGGEVKRGDIIVYGSASVRGFVKFADSKLGVVNAIVPRRTHKRDSATWKKLFKDSISNQFYNPANLPDTIDTFEKVAFYPLFEGDDGYNNGPSMPPVCRKNGKPKRNVILTTSFLIINRETLSDKWKGIYDGACKAFKI
jgi:hypothetical protein